MATPSTDHHVAPDHRVHGTAIYSPALLGSTSIYNRAQKRRRMGVRMILFLIVLGGLTYAVKRKIWADVKH